MSFLSSPWAAIRDVVAAGADAATTAVGAATSAVRPGQYITPHILPRILFSVMTAGI